LAVWNFVSVAVSLVTCTAAGSPICRFPTRIREELVTAGKAEPHHVLPRSGWVSRRITGHHDVDAVLELFRLNYERAWTRGKDDSEVEHGSSSGK
jgi:hypothetical protein